MKPDKSKVQPSIAKLALSRASGDKQRAWSEYIRAMYQSTGSLAPGCDAKDFYAYIDSMVITHG